MAPVRASHPSLSSETNVFLNIFHIVLAKTIICDEIYLKYKIKIFLQKFDILIMQNADLYIFSFVQL